MLDWPSRALLGVTAALVAFTAYGMALNPPSARLATAPSDSAVALPTEPIPDFALQPALPADAAPEEGASSSATATTADGGPRRPITIAFAGDVHGEDPIEGLLEDGINPFEGVADLLGQADITVVNLETAVGTTGEPADKTFVFQARPELATAMADVGVDVVNLANNHGLDMGLDAGRETVAIMAGAGVSTVGFGEDADAAYTPAILEVGGRTVAVIGLSRVFPVVEWAATATRAGLASAYDADAATAAVAQAAELADHVVVTVHWGQERHVCPNGDQLALARAFTAAGADVVVGHHPHVLQGLVEEDGTLVAYSIGNFVFYARTPATRQSGVLTVTLSDEGVSDHTWSPATIDGQGRPQPVASQAPMPTGETLTATSSGPQCGPPA